MHDPLVRDLLFLMEIPSVTGAEGPLADALMRRFEAGGAGGRACVRFGDSVVVGPRSILPAGEGKTDRPLIVLAGHLDTVPKGDAGDPRIEAGAVHGRGACDMKAGLAVMLRLLDTLEPSEGFADLAYVFYAGEEGPAEANDLPNVLAHVPALARADLAVLLEPTGGALELGCQGSVHCRITFEGRACHSARPWLGLHPLAGALPWMERALAFGARRVALAGVEFLEVATITQVHAGEVRNVLPGRLEINLNLRYPPDRTPAEAEALARSLCPDPRPWNPSFDGAAPTPQDVGVQVEIVDHAPAGAIAADDPLYRHVLEATGLPRRGKQAWTDVARFTAVGVPALNWGPGDPHLAHTREERVDLESLRGAFEAMHRFFAGPGPESRRAGRKKERE
jgi:succinyl-diaminopimelate desuccinylase